MSVFNTLIILVLTASLAVAILTWGRIFSYNRSYNLPESKYTRLFHVFTKEHIAILYMLIVIIHAIVTIAFLWSL